MYFLHYFASCMITYKLKKETVSYNNNSVITTVTSFIIKATTINCLNNNVV